MSVAVQFEYVRNGSSTVTKDSVLLIITIVAWFIKAGLNVRHARLCRG